MTKPPETESENNFGIVARNSMSSTSRRASQVSLLADTNVEVSHSNHVDDRNWSWSFLRRTFRINDLGKLYQRYVQRLQNAYFNVYLILQLFLSLIYIGLLLYFSLNYEVNKCDISVTTSPTTISVTDLNCIPEESPMELAVPEIWAHGIISVFCVIAFLIVFDEKAIGSESYPWTQVVLSIIYTIVIAGADLSLSVYFYIQFGTKRTAFTFQTLIVIYFFLPLPRKVQTIALGALVSTAHLAFSGIVFYRTDDIGVYPRIMADFFYYFCANAVGTYSLLLSEVTVRRAFIDRRGYIKSTIKKEYEKSQEEQLLSSILPSHIAEEVRKELKQAVMSLKLAEQQNQNNHHPKQQGSGSNKHHHPSRHSRGPTSSDAENDRPIHKKPFSDLFVERHNNVTILYADIVNFTPLTVKLEAAELVNTLNELFGRFDEAATTNKCLRIKLLGDCYYCVSGLQDSATPHAKNCVLLGLQMIEIIKDIRDSLNVDVAMRIGIHTGNILSGLLGIVKWQYDIWSKDVTIANHMEQSGRPGRIHITEQTKKFLGDEFNYKPGYGKQRDKYLADNNIETYLIETSTAEDKGNFESNELEVINPAKTMYNRTQGNNTIGSATSQFNQRRQSTSATKNADSMIRKKSIRINPDRRTNLFGNDVQTFRTMMTKVNEKMEKAIEEMPLRKSDQWCRRGSTPSSNLMLNQTVDPLLMNFESFSSEKQFQTQPDPLFKFYISCSLLVLTCIGLIQAISVPLQHLVLWLSFGGALIFLIGLIPFVWTGYIWSRLKDPHRELDVVPDAKNKFVLFFCECSNIVSNSWLARTVLYVTICLLVSAFAIIDVIECDNDNQDSTETEDECQSPWYFTYSCSLALLVIYSFFRVHFLLKFALSVIALAAYGTIIFYLKDHVFEQKTYGMSPALSLVGAETYSHFIYLVGITALLHIMDRQMEYINRLDFIWKKKLTDEHEEASMTHSINTILIHNILPMQIAKIYLDPNRIGEGHNQSYKNISVMFASIPNFMDFNPEDDPTDNDDIKRLKLLNQIIVEFDQVLLQHKDVEKIKVIGSTYMAACGLEVHDPGRVSTGSMLITESDSAYVPTYKKDTSNTTVNPQKRRTSLLTLVKLASEMMIKLQTVNNKHKLRVGLATGAVVAGVIGAKKPLYDIWGDTVNLSSRMDSTGVAGKIQVNQECAQLLMQEGVVCEERGTINVKGKGQILTYYVTLNERLEVVYDIERKFESTDL